MGTENLLGEWDFANSRVLTANPFTSGSPRRKILVKNSLPNWILVLCLAGCTTIPDRLKIADSLYERCGYAADGETSEGFSLEIAYTEYQFFPTPDPVILAARECFSKTAAELARRRGKTITPLASGDMSATANRNILDANYLVNVTGKVRFAQK
jgi:hypothetical protein